VTRLGFEVKIDLDVAGEPAWAQVTRGTCEQLGLSAGQAVYVRRVGSQIRVVPAVEAPA
jgi:sulfate transport system ATP-binding protein